MVLENLIQAVDGFELHNNTIKTSFGTTKYCSFYVRDQTCNNQDCLYLHSKAAPADIIDKVRVVDTRTPTTSQKRSSRNNRRL